MKPLWIGSLLAWSLVLVAMGTAKVPDSGTLLSDHDLIGYAVRDADGGWIGPVHSLVADLDTGEIQYVVVELPARPLSYGDHTVPRLLPIPWQRLDPNREVHILNVQASRVVLEEAPKLNRRVDAHETTWNERVLHFWSAH